MYKTLKIEIGGAIATVTLNRPESRNAMSSTLMREMIAIAGRIGAKPEIDVVRAEARQMRPSGIRFGALGIRGEQEGAVGGAQRQGGPHFDGDGDGEEGTGGHGAVTVPSGRYSD